jgi:hypothetical protein
MLITRFLGGLSYAFGRCKLSNTRTPESIAEAVCFIHPIATLRLAAFRAERLCLSANRSLFVRLRLRTNDEA